MNPEDAALLEGGANPASVVDASASATSKPRGTSPVVVKEVVLANDSVMIGSAVGSDGAVSARKPAYGISDTVYASVPVGGYAPGMVVAIYWFGDNGVSLKGERKPIPAGAKYLNFSLSKADGMAAGKYTAQVDVGDAPLGLADFTVK